MDATEKKAVPPYVAYKTLVNFLDKFKQGIPSRVDRGLMGTMSGASQSQVTTALRFLGMISENNVTNPKMKEYVVGDEEQKKTVLQEMLVDAYPFIFRQGFDLSNETAKALRDAFVANTGATGETVNRCIAFFKDAAVDAGIPISRFILNKTVRSPQPKKRSVVPRKEEPKSVVQPTQTQDHAASSPAAQVAIPAQGSMLLWGLIQKLPKPGTRWAQADRERWVQTLNHVMELEYPGPGE